MDENKEKLLEKIKKLFAMGDSSRNPNEEEVKTALAMATKLMKENNLTLSDVELIKDKDNINTTSTHEQGNYHSWERDLVIMVGELFECKPYLEQTSYYPRKYVYRYIGLSQDATMAQLCYEYLHYHIKLLAALMSKNKMEFYAGITHRLRERINDEINNRTPEETVKCTAIIALKNQLVSDWAEKNLNLTMKPHHTKNYHNENSKDFINGYIAGGGLDIGTKQKIT